MLLCTLQTPKRVHPDEDLADTHNREAPGKSTALEEATNEIQKR